MNNLLRKVMERTANLRSTSERRMEEVKIGVLPKTGLGINVLASDAVHRVIAARAFGVRVTLPLKDLLLLPGKSLPQACSNRLAENISNEQAIASQCTELKPPPPGRPGEDEAWSGPGHAARSALG